MVKTSPLFTGNQNLLRLGILGGTFNPPHMGHLRLAEEAACTHELFEVIFIPCFLPPHKDTKFLASAQDRLEMTRLACQGNSSFRVSDIEISFNGPSYTCNTLKYLRETTRCQVFFIIGTDSLSDISSWRDYEKLFELCSFIVVSRPGMTFSSAWLNVPHSLRNKFRLQGDRFIHSSGHFLIRSPIRGLDISSTRIRDLVKSGHSIRYLVPESVRNFIAKRDLYADHERQT
jgi:nicotinate-nucleotide adenylyltransferase